MKQIERKNMMRELFIHAGCMKGMSQMIVYMQDEIKGGDKDYSCRMLERMRDIMLEEVEKVEKIAEQIQEELDLP